MIKLGKIKSNIKERARYFNDDHWLIWQKTLCFWKRSIMLLFCAGLAIIFLSLS